MNRWGPVRLVRALVACVIMCIAAAPMEGRSAAWSDTIVLIDAVAHSARDADGGHGRREDAGETASAPALSSTPEPATPGSSASSGADRIARRAYLRNCALLL